MPPRPRHRHPMRTAFIAAMLVCLVGGVWYWSNHRPQTSSLSGGSPGAKGRGPGGSKPQPVSVAAIRSMDIRVWLNALGTVTPLNLVTVRPRVDGTLLRVTFSEGQMVESGMLLAEIDPRPFQIQLAQAKGQLDRDQALLDNARIDQARYRELLGKDAISRQQVDTQTALVRQYEGTVEADRGQLDNAKLQLEYTRIVAPTAGRIGLRQIDPGNQVHASDSTGLASIARLQPITVIFAVPEANLPAIGRRLAGHERVRIEAWDREQKIRLAEGHLLTTDNQIDPATGTIRLKAAFDNRSNALFPNQFVNIRLLLDTLPQATALPFAAVQRGDKGSYVYRVDAGGTVTTVPVTPGAVDGEWQAVSGALRAGDRVVIDGADKLRDGAKVEVIVPGAASGKGGAGKSGHAGKPRGEGSWQRRPER